ncbi:MAG: ABC transporter ATP-binding protein [Clostridia bacterium]|nr:ABC transporter ATP-binding protein [Clostridia bacterium]
MIKAESITKRFGNFTALSSVDVTLEKGCVYGLVGSNGAGKSTLLRVLTGVYRPDSGRVTLDGAPVYDNPAAKKRIVYVPDELYFLPGADIARMASLYRAVYPDFDGARLYQLTRDAGLAMDRPIAEFSKGMKRQAATMLALAARPDYLFFDETFDGLDPVVRNHIKNVIGDDVLSRGASAVITSHSLRELEDTCDQLAMLHRGGMVLESDVGKLRTRHVKVQIAFHDDFNESRFGGIEIARYSKHGSVCSMILSGDTEAAVERLRAMEPAILDVLPLSLEEMFTFELETLGYKFEEGGPL